MRGVLNTKKNTKETYDVVIVGGGPAGLNAALVLGRSRRSVLVIDEELPRNRVTRESHGFLTRDGITPADFRSIAKEQISKYPSVIFESGIVKSVTGSDEDFHLLLESPGVAARSRKILFATGMKDVLPNIEGLVEVYGTSAFVCPFCDGWELRDKHICVVAPNDLNLHFVKMISGWTKYVTLLTNGSQFLSSDQLADLELHGVYVVQDEIKRIESIQGYVNRITFRSNAPVKCEGIFFSPTLIQSTALPERLGCELSDNGTVVKIATDPMGRTNVPGVYSAGDAAGAPFQLISAASSGATTAAAIQLDLLDIEWKSVQ